MGLLRRICWSAKNLLDRAASESLFSGSAKQPTFPQSPDARHCPSLTGLRPQHCRVEIPFRQNPQLVVGCDDGASLDFAVVKELVGLVGAVDRKVFDEHLDLCRLGELDDFYQLGDGAPKR